MIWHPVFVCLLSQVVLLKQLIHQMYCKKVQVSLKIMVLLCGILSNKQDFEKFHHCTPLASCLLFSAYFSQWPLPVYYTEHLPLRTCWMMGSRWDLRLVFHWWLFSDDIFLVSVVINNFKQELCFSALLCMCLGIATWFLKTWRRCGQKCQRLAKGRRSQSQWTKIVTSQKCFFVVIQ